VSPDAAERHPGSTFDAWLINRASMVRDAQRCCAPHHEGRERLRETHRASIDQAMGFRTGSTDHNG
jgi:hypothetical protein